MTDRQREKFEALLIRALGGIAASPRRLHMMREEMLCHLVNCYEEELARRGDERAAADEAMKRLGDANELRAQLQASVPFCERLFFMWFDRKERFMLRWLWIAGMVLWIVGSQFSFAHNEQLEFAGVGLFCGCTFWHLAHRQNLALRWIGPRWPWLVGCVAVLFGTAVVLPALAKIKHEGGIAPMTVAATMLGALIVLAGLGFLARAIRNQSPSAV